MDTQDHDDDGRLLWHAVVLGLAVEALAVVLFFACAFVWFGILSGRI